jgi:hypothetical protein
LKYYYLQFYLIFSLNNSIRTQPNSKLIELGFDFENPTQSSHSTHWVGFWVE